MHVYDRTWLMHSVAEDRKRIARYGMWAGDSDDYYFRRCRAYHEPTGTVMIFSRDVGHHSSGWWKNPDYERCYHLSLSFVDPATKERAPRDVKLSRQWVDAFYGKDARLLWCEPPYSRDGRSIEVWHYRLFCAPDWSPILPRGEVYSRELTEAGWKSYSDVQAEMAAVEERARERQAD